MIHRILHGHWFKPNIIGYDRHYFDIYDGCERCMEKK